MFVLARHTAAPRSNRSLPKSELVECAQRYAHSYSRPLTRLAEETGLHYQWLRKFASGKFTNPGAAKVEVRIPRHSAMHSTLIRPPIPEAFGRAVGAKRRWVFEITQG